MTKAIKKVVYGCITGGYDNIPTHKYIAPDWDYVLFTDDKELVKQGRFAHWTIKPLAFDKLSNVKNARWHKVNAHKLFPEYDYSLWLDSNIIINDAGLFNLANDLIKQKILVAVPNHPERVCIYDEAEIIKEYRIDTPRIVDKEMQILRHDKYPKNNGLSETGILLRRHNDMKSTLDLWWSMIEKYSKRDQLSFNYALWKTNIERTPIYSGPYGFGIHRQNETFSFVYQQGHGTDKLRKVVDNKKFYIPLWLARIICLFIFSHEARRKFRHKYVKPKQNFGYAETFKTDIMKYNAFCKCDIIKTVVLGSSHARDAFVPDVTSFNFGNSSQDLYRAFKVYKYITKQNRKDLHNVILFWSVFHPGLQLEKTKEYLRCVPYKFFYDAKYIGKFPIPDKEILQELKHAVKTVSVPDGYRGESLYDVEHTDITHELVAKHIKNTQRNNNQIQYLGKIADLASKYNHKLYVVLPPYRQDYLDCLPKDNDIYFELFDFLSVHPEITLLNFQRDKDFLDTDFDSADHCNRHDAEKLTKKINRVIK